MEIQELTPQEVIEACKNGAVFVDVREPYELEEVAYDVTNFMHIPLGEIQERMDEFPKDTPIICGCRSGKRSMNACMFLSMQGFENVSNLKGGIIGWVENGAPTR